MIPRLRLAYRTFAGFQNALSRQIGVFREHHSDFEIELVAHDIPTLYAAMVDGDGCRSGDWDLFLCSSDWLPPLMQRGDLLRLDPFLRDRPPQDWPHGWSPSLLSVQTRPDGTYGLPYHDGPEMFMYRGDLFDDPAEREHFSSTYGYALAPPRTWSEFLDIARHFTRPEQNLYGCVLAAMPDGHNSVYDFLIQLWSRGGSVLDGNRAAFNSRQGHEALSFLYDLVCRYNVTQPEPRTYESVRSGDYYAAGHAAMMWNWCGFAVVADRPESPARGRSRLGLIPRGDGSNGKHVSLTSYWVMTIPRGATDPGLAWEFVRHLTTPEMDLLTATEGAVACRLSTWRDPEIQAAYPCYRLIEETHQRAHTTPGISEYPRINDVLNEEIDAVYRRAKTVDQALADGARRTNDILASAQERR